MLHVASPADRRDLLGRSGALSVRLADGARDVARAQRLRARVFGRASDADEFDAACDHVLVETGTGTGTGTGEVVATYRLLPQGAGHRSYAAGEFEVDALYAAHPGLRFLELGRSCVAAEWRTGRVMELLWHGTWAYVVRGRFDVMLGCASLPGTRPDRALLAFLRESARAPRGWRVRARAGRGRAMRGEAAAPRAAWRALPPLVRGYLRLGAHVGEEAVIDRDFGTTDVLVLLRRELIARRYLDHFGEAATRYAA